MPRLDVDGDANEPAMRRPSASDAFQSPHVRSIVPPRQRSFRRWRSLGFARCSLTRALQEEALTDLPLSGRVLDIGGGRRSAYASRIRLDGTLETANINPAVSPDHLCDLEKPLPFSDGSFDHVLSMNTLEHIYHDVTLLEEALRVLKPGGSLHVLVPFCQRVHGSPHDYHRHTAEWWLRTLSERHCLGVRIEPLVWNRFSTGFALITTGAYLVRALAMALPDPRLAVGAVRRVRRGESPTTREARGAILADFALGYYVSARRSGSASGAETAPCP